MTVGSVRLGRARTTSIENGANVIMGPADGTDQVPDTDAAVGAVVAAGRMEDGADAIAVWHVDGRGGPTGAWIESQERVLGDRDAARTLLRCVERCAITAVDRDTVAEIVGKLTVAAEVDAPSGWWEPQVFAAVDGMADVIVRRDEFTRTLAVRRASGRSVAPITWRRVLDDREVLGHQCGHDALRRAARVAVAASSPVATEALEVVHVLRWVSALWTETEQVKNRRRYVLETHGPVEALPPSWALAAAVAGANRLSL